MPRDDSLHRRLQALREAVRQLGSSQLAAYQVTGARSHHERLAHSLQELYADPVLAEAGFLHGVPRARLPELAVPPAEGVEAILECWERLRRPRIEAEHALSRRELLRDVLTGLGEPRGAFLLAHERLDRWDPRGEVLRWTEAFRSAAFELEARSRSRVRSAELEHLRDVAAVVAEHCGLWDVRNTLENLALVHSDRGQFRGVVGWARHLDSEGVTRQLVRAVDKVLPPLPRRRSAARWEWRHVASIAANVRLDRPGKAKIARLWRSAYVTIECGDAPTCYRLMGELHNSRAIRYRPSAVLDTIGRPTRAGYRALHSIVTVEVDDRQIPLAVRFVPRESRTDEGRPTPPQLLARCMREARSRTEGISVFTPAGAFKHLPAGATVLNFAAAVHSDFVGGVSHAIINDSEQVGVLHRLADGDRCELVKASRPSLPPAGWEEAVPTETRRGLKDQLRTNLAPVLRSEGLLWIRKEMVARGAKIDDEPMLWTLLGIASEVAAEALGLKRPRSATWWAEALGLWVLQRRGEEQPWRSGLDPRKVEVLAESLAGVLQRLQYRDDEVELPESMKASVQRIQKCPECRPGSGTKVLVTLDGNTVVVHDAEADCAEGGQQIRVGGTPTLRQYFVAETTNRDGVAIDVLTVFHDARVEVVDIAGRRLGPGWAVVRVEAELIGPQQIRALLRELRKVDGVQRVRTPSKQPLEVLEGGLPPRRERPPEPWAVPQPYVCGDFVREDHAFYGRTEELARLEQALAYTQAAGAESGASVFIGGPLKTGKTSLAKRFLRDLKRRRTAVVAPIFCKAQVGEAWPALEKRLAELLADEVARVSVSEGWALPRKLPTDDLEELLKQLRRSVAAPTAVLVIDEALRPMRRAHRLAAEGDRAELEDVVRFRDLVERSPGTLVVYVGPSAPVRRLHPDLARVLREADPVTLQPFGADDATALLCARKIAWRYPIEVKKSVARAATALAGGNPFWINHLAYWMYKEQSRRPVRPIRYSHGLLRSALEELLQRPGLFEDRLFPDGDPSHAPPWIWDLATLLASGPDAGSEDDPGWSVPKLRQALVQRGVELPEEAVLDAAEDLAAMGGVVWTVGPAGAQAVRLMAPILASFVEQQNRRGRRGLGDPPEPVER